MSRTPDEIREEIRIERARLDAALTDFSADAKRSGRIAGSALAGLASVMLLRRIRRHFSR